MDAQLLKTIAEEAAEYRPMLYRMALIQLKNADAAEDATQETLLAAVEKAVTFEARSSLRTWLFAILRFKILDIMRDQSKFRKFGFPIPSDNREIDDYEVGAFDVLFDTNGCWVDAKDFMDKSAHGRGARSLFQSIGNLHDTPTRADLAGFSNAGMA